MRLSSSQIERYWEQGYLLLPGLIPERNLAAYEDRFVALASGDAPPAPGMMIMHDVMVVKGAVTPATPLHGVNKLINLEDDAPLYAYTLEPGLLGAVRSLIGDDLYSIASNVFNKPPGVDGRHPLHQDLRYFRIRPADRIIGTWTAFGATNRENGCLAVIPGSHKGPLHDHDNPDWEHVNAGFFGIEPVGLGERGPCAHGGGRHPAVPSAAHPRLRPQPQPGLPPRHFKPLRSRGLRIPRAQLAGGQAGAPHRPTRLDLHRLQQPGPVLDGCGHALADFLHGERCAHRVALGDFQHVPGQQ